MQARDAEKWKNILFAMEVEALDFKRLRYTLLNLLNFQTKRNFEDQATVCCGAQNPELQSWNIISMARMVILS